jgi:hypothetical protein
MHPLKAHDFYFTVIASKLRFHRLFFNNNRLFNHYINASLSFVMNIITMFDLHNAVTLAPPGKFKYFKLSICNASIANLISFHRSLILMIADEQFTFVLALVKGDVFSEKFINSNDNFSSRHNFSSSGWISAL